MKTANGTKKYFVGKILSSIDKSSSNLVGYLNLARGIQLFNPKPGSVIWLDFLPYRVTDPKHPDRDDARDIATPGSLWYTRPFKIHRGVGIENKVIVCPSSVGSKCPICEYRSVQLKKGVTWNSVQPLKPSGRNLYVVIPKKSKDHDETIHIWNVAFHHFGKLLREELEADPDYERFPSLEDGYTLRIRFDEQIFGKKTFGAAIRIDFEPRQKQYDMSILDKVPNLDETLVVMEYDEIKDLFFEGDLTSYNEQSDNQQEDEDIKSFSSKVTLSRESYDEDEYEDDDVPLDDSPPRRIKLVIDKVPGSGEKKCPHGYVYKRDGGSRPECETCKVWDECTRDE